jgi:hypothetical protein
MPSVVSASAKAVGASLTFSTYCLPKAQAESTALSPKEGALHEHEKDNEENGNG